MISIAAKSQMLPQKKKVEEEKKKMHPILILLLRKSYHVLETITNSHIFVTVILAPHCNTGTTYYNVTKINTGIFDYE